MLPVASVSEIRRAETEYFGSADVLQTVLTVGEKMAEYILASPLMRNRKSLLAVCGQGNNGADGMAAAAVLKKAGLDVRVVFVGDAGKKSAPAAFCMEQCRELLCDLSPADAVLDAIFGIGFHGIAEGREKEAIEFINRLHEKGAVVFSADVPSGLGSEFKVHPDITIGVQAVKYACACGTSAAACGAPAAIDALIPGVRAEAQLIEHGDLRTFLPRKSPYGHKNSFGAVGIIGGCAGMEGAAMLSAEAAAKTGAGKVRILSPLPYYAARSPHLLLMPCEPDNDALRGLDAAAFGMGAGRTEHTAVTARMLIQSELPLVLDADALWALHSARDMLKKRKERGLRCVLTPHIGEALHLIDDPALFADTAAIEANPVAAALHISRKYYCDVILKSWYSVIVSNGVWILNSPTPALATAGSGDCLAGICAAVLARGGQIPAAALIHNAAGHRAGTLYGRDSVTAEDIIRSVYLD